VIGALMGVVVVVARSIQLYTCMHVQVQQLEVTPELRRQHGWAVSRSIIDAYLFRYFFVLASARAYSGKLLVMWQLAARG
jgi:hypothetical protein